MPQQEGGLEKLRRLSAAPAQAPQQRVPEQSVGRFARELFTALIPNPVQIAEAIGYAGGLRPFVSEVARSDAERRAALGERGQEQIATGMERGPSRLSGDMETALGLAETAPFGIGAGASVARQLLTNRSGVQGVGNIAASAIPIVGPAAAEAGETIPRDPTKGLAEATALLAPSAVGAAGRRLRTTRGEPFAGIPFAEDVPLTVSQREGTFIAPKLRAITARVESFLERSSFGAGPASARLRQVKQQISKGARDLFDQIATPGGANEVLEGNQILELTRNFVRQAYDDASNAVGSELASFAQTPASRRSLKVLAQDLLGEVESTLAPQGGILPPRLAAGDVALLRNILASDMRTTVPVLQRERSALLDITRRIRGDIAAPGEGKVKLISHRIDREMVSAVRASHGRDAAQKFRDTLKAYGEVRRMADGVVEDLILHNELQPEKIGPLLMRSGSGTISAAQKALPDRAFRLAVRSGLEDLWNKSTTGELTAPSAAQAASGAIRRLAGADVQVETFNPSRFMAELEGIGKPKLNMLLGADSAQRLVQLARFTQKATRAGGLSEISTQLRAPQLFAAGSDAFLAIEFLTSSPLAAGAKMAAINALSRIWFNPRLQRTFHSALRMAANKNGTAVAWFLARLDDQMKNEEKP